MLIYRLYNFAHKECIDSRNAHSLDRNRRAHYLLLDSVNDEIQKLFLLFIQPRKKHRDPLSRKTHSVNVPTCFFLLCSLVSVMDHEAM